MYSASCSVKAKRMGEDQRYSLRWNDFYTNIVSAFKTLKETEDFVDVTIACDGKSVKAHQVILSAASPFFRKLLKDNPCQHPIVILKDVRYQDMESLMSFMYHGEVQVSQEDLTEFLRAAQTLQIKGLTDVPHISPPRSPTESVTPPPLHIPEVRLGVEVDERSCDSGGTKRPHGNRGEDVDISSENKSEEGNDESEDKSGEMDSGQVAAVDSGNKTAAEQSSGEPATKKQKGQTEAKIIEGDNNNQTNGNMLEVGDKIKGSGNGNNGSILIQALEQGRQNYDKDEGSKMDTASSNAMMMDEDSSPDEADMKYDDKLDESGEELSAHALNEAMRFPAAAALLGFQGLPGFLPGPSSMQNNGGSSLDVSRRSLDMLRVRATDPRPCPKCGKIYRSAHTLRTHLEDKHTICPGYRCVLCGTVAKSRNSLHSHMSRQHRGISTKDLPVLPMPAPFDPQLAARLLAKAGVKFPANEIPSGRSSPLQAPPMRRTGLEVTAIPSEKPTSPKSSRTSSATSNMPLPPKIDPQTTGSAILDTYLQFIAENSLAHLGGQLQYAQQRAASLHRNALEKAAGAGGGLQEPPQIPQAPPLPQVIEAGGGDEGADADESADEET